MKTIAPIDDGYVLGLHSEELLCMYSALVGYLAGLRIEPDRLGPEIELVSDMVTAVRELLDTATELVA